MPLDPVPREGSFRRPARLPVPLVAGSNVKAQPGRQSPRGYRRPSTGPNRTSEQPCFWLFSSPRRYSPLSLVLGVPSRGAGHEPQPAARQSCTYRAFHSIDFAPHRLWAGSAFEAHRDEQPRAPPWDLSRALQKRLELPGTARPFALRQKAGPTARYHLPDTANLSSGKGASPDHPGGRPAPMCVCPSPAGGKNWLP
jgi:hypothetical protein